MPGPIGPSGYNGSQGPVGPQGVPGPAGPKGSGDLSQCQLKKKVKLRSVVAIGYMYMLMNQQ